MFEYRNAAKTIIARIDEATGHVVIIEPNNPLWDLIPLGQISPYVAPAPAPLTVDDYRRAVDTGIERVARAKGYNSAAALAGYATSTVPAWAAEAAAFVAWRDAVWLAVFAVLGDVQGGGEAPTLEALIEGLPAIEWPEA